MVTVQLAPSICWSQELARQSSIGSEPAGAGPVFVVVEPPIASFVDPAQAEPKQPAA
jgi:hypothetical protein